MCLYLIKSINSVHRHPLPQGLSQCRDSPRSAWITSNHFVSASYLGDSTVFVEVNFGGPQIFFFMLDNVSPGYGMWENAF